MSGIYQLAFALAALLAYLQLRNNSRSGAERCYTCSEAAYLNGLEVCGSCLVKKDGKKLSQGEFSALLLARKKKHGKRKMWTRILFFLFLVPALTGLASLIIF